MAGYSQNDGEDVHLLQSAQVFLTKPISPQTLYTTDFSFSSKLKFLPDHTFENTEYLRRHGTEYFRYC
jgi:hypothetical protein